MSADPRSTCWPCLLGGSAVLVLAGAGVIWLAGLVWSALVG